MNMVSTEKRIFITLFCEACEKCFSQPLTEALKEPDAKRLADEIQDKTGLVIGWKSIKNFSLFATHSELRKDENPSVATLDTLARYVLEAPVTDDLKRKATESHYPYWYDYRSRFTASTPEKEKRNGNKRKIRLWFSVSLIVLAALFLVYRTGRETHYHVDNFSSVNEDSLSSRGWTVSRRNHYWSKRGQLAGHLTLYTLRGDNWRSDNGSPLLSNVLTRRIGGDCFNTEIHLSDFLPYENWHQAGILLSEDSTFTGKGLRLSIAYNSFFGGFKRPPEIIIQVVGSTDREGVSKPEEIAHVPVFTGDIKRDSVIRSNLSKSALKIEKRNNQYRFLFSIGEMESFAFKEAAYRDFDIEPRYLGLFATHGLSNHENPVPVHFDSFNVVEVDCRD
jgi:hypothetical protein